MATSPTSDTSATVSAASPEEGGRRRRTSKRHLEFLGKGLSGACIALVALLVFTLIFMVCEHGITPFTKDGVSLLSFLTGTTWNPHQVDDAGNMQVGALPMICGSFAVTLLSCLFVLPFAIGSAIFMVEIKPDFCNKFFRPALELLVGIPSVVYGLVGLMVIVPWTRSWAGGTGYGIFSGSLVLAVMVLPTVTSLSADAIAAVPDAYRQGSYALGATRWQNIRHIVLPAARNGILTAIILGMTRAFGEALAIQMVVGNAAAMPTSLFTPASTLTSVLTMSMGNEAMGTVYNDVLWSLALILLIMSLIFILIIHIVGRGKQVNHG